MFWRLVSAGGHWGIVVDPDRGTHRVLFVGAIRARPAPPVYLPELGGYAAHPERMTPPARPLALRGRLEAAMSAADDGVGRAVQVAPGVRITRRHAPRTYVVAHALVTWGLAQAFAGPLAPVLEWWGRRSDREAAADIVDALARDPLVLCRVASAAVRDDARV